MAKKQRLSEAIWDDERERWCCRVTLDGKRRAFYSTMPGRKGKREAERKADDWLENGSANGNARVGVLWAAFMAYELKMRGEKNATYMQHNKIGRLYILPEIEHKRLEDMRPIDWQACITEPYSRSCAAGKPLSAKTLKNIRGALTAFKTHCEDLDILIPSLRNLRIPDSAPVGERKILQPHDVALLFQPPKPTTYGGDRNVHYLHLWRFQVLTGLRPGEALALKHEDITDEGMCSIRRAVNVEGVITDGKNRNAHRTFLLPQRAQAVLADQAEYLRECGIISPFIFPAPDGSIASELRVYKNWHRFCEIQGIAKCSLYELRHTMVSMSTDIPDALLKPMVGHGHNMDTRGTYSHEVQGNRARTAAMLEDTFTNIISLDATLDAIAQEKTLQNA